MLEGAFELRDLGEQLKGLTVPLRLYQPGAGAVPPLQVLDRRGCRSTWTRWSGASASWATLCAGFRGTGARVVRSRGPAASARRASRRLQHRAVGRHSDGVTFVDLAPIRDPEVVLPTIADALAIEGDLASQIGIGRHHGSITCRQVVDAAPDIAGSPLPRRASPCSRRAAVPADAGEHEFRLRPLSEAPAVELFRQRAQAAVRLRGRLSTARQNLRTARQPAPRYRARCSTWMKDLHPTSSSSGSTMSSRSWPPRIAACRARRNARDDPVELRAPHHGGGLLFDRPAVFRGGWTVDAAEAVCDADLDTLTSLVDKNLVREDGEQFRMLETVREYARERLQPLSPSNSLTTVDPPRGVLRSARASCGAAPPRSRPRVASIVWRPSTTTSGQRSTAASRRTSAPTWI